MRADLPADHPDARQNSAQNLEPGVLEGEKVEPDGTVVGSSKAPWQGSARTPDPHVLREAVSGSERPELLELELATEGRGQGSAEPEVEVPTQDALIA